jgi:hypothetical protein
MCIDLFQRVETIADEILMSFFLILFHFCHEIGDGGVEDSLVGYSMASKKSSWATTTDDMSFLLSRIPHQSSSLAIGGGRNFLVQRVIS